MPDNPEQTSASSLASLNEESYGNRYRADVIKIYELYVQSSDHISSRRQTANSYFLTIATSILGVKVAFPGASAFSAFLLFGGVILCFLWRRAIRSYRDINSAKFKVIHQLEAMLSVAPYRQEWDLLERGKNPKAYKPFTHIEMLVPLAFAALFLMMLAYEAGIMETFENLVLSGRAV